MPKQQKGRRRKGKFVDEIQEDRAKPHVPPEKDADLPGGGEFYCVECARYFVSGTVLEAHRNTKLHKRRVKKVNERPFTVAEAEAAGGVGSYEDYVDPKKCA